MGRRALRAGWTSPELEFVALEGILGVEERPLVSGDFDLAEAIARARAA